MVLHALPEAQSMSRSSAANFKPRGESGAKTPRTQKALHAKLFFEPAFGVRTRPRVALDVSESRFQRNISSSVSAFLGAAPSASLSK